MIDFDLLAEECTWRAIIRNVKVVSGSGQCDEQQAAFALQVLGVGDRAAGGSGQSVRRG
jgi:hypothetical protein